MRTQLRIALALLGLATAFAIVATGSEAPSTASIRSGSSSKALQLKVQSILTEEQVRLAWLNEEFQNARSTDQALAVQKQIHALKTGTELRILELQVEHLEEHGKLDAARELRESLERMKDPNRTRTPALRENPTATVAPASSAPDATRRPAGR